jgi:hypothetical protein
MGLDPLKDPVMSKVHSTLERTRALAALSVLLRDNFAKLKNPRPAEDIVEDAIRKARIAAMDAVRTFRDLAEILNALEQSEWQNSPRGKASRLPPVYVEVPRWMR